MAQNLSGSVNEPTLSHCQIKNADLKYSEIPCFQAANRSRNL